MTTDPTDAQRTARLVFDRELAAGTISAAALDDAAARLAPAPFPGRARAAAARIALKAGVRSFTAATLEHYRDVRRRALGLDADGPPRLLIRVDEFPYGTSFDEPERYGAPAAAAFHAALADAGVPYLMAVVPQLTHRPFDPAASGGRPLGDAELALLHRMRAEGVTFALHGLTHRTRYAAAQQRSELGGLAGPELLALVDEGLRRLADAGAQASVLVPPFNRFDARQWGVLASRFDVIAGGPESVALLGLQPTPQWRGDAVYLPSYPPYYGRAKDLLPRLGELEAAAAGLWTPVTLHLAWELDDGLEHLRRFAERVAPLATPWPEFLAAAGRSRSVP